LYAAAQASNILNSCMVNKKTEHGGDWGT